MKNNLKYMMEVTEKFFKLIGMKNEISLSDEDDESAEMFIHGHVVSLEKATGTFYLLKIKTFGGTRWEPPSEDYIEIYQSNNMLDVLRFLTQELVIETLEHIKFDEQFEEN